MGDPQLRPLRLSFGRVADTYHSVRPPYFGPLLDRAQQALELQPSARVLDLAAGTGRLTHELAQRFDHVVAVEPDDEMRALIADGEVLVGTAEAIPLDDDSVDAVFVGEAFHWFDARAAIAELARVLVPRGGLAIVSTHWWETEPPLHELAQAVLRERHARVRTQRNPPWDDAFDDSPFDRATRDGFAVRAEDWSAGKRLRVIGQVRAGEAMSNFQNDSAEGELLTQILEYRASQASEAEQDE